MNRYHYHLNLVLFWLISLPIWGQQVSNQVRIQIVQPVQNRSFEGTLNDLTAIGDQLQVQIQQLTGTNRRRVNLVATLENFAQTVRIRTVTNTAIELNGTAPFMLYGRNLTTFFDASSIDVEGMDRNDLIQGGFVPEGFYRLCVIAYDADIQDGFTSQISNPNLSGCVTLRAQYPEPPRINLIANSAVQPDTGLVVTQTLFNILWSPTTGNGTSFQYTLRIADMGDGELNPEVAFMDPTIAFQQVRQPTYEQTTPSTNMMVGMGGMLVVQLEENHRYAVQVQAVAADGSGVKNNGFSQVVAFWFGNKPSGNRAVARVAPTINYMSYPQGGYMPFRGMPVVVKFNPYSENYSRWDSYFTISGQGPSGNRTLPELHRPLGWNGRPPGPLAAQREATKNPSLTVEQAQHIAISHNNSEIPYSFYQYVGRGKEYAWNGTVVITDGTGRNEKKVERELSGSFIAGMDKPQLSIPANKSTQQPGTITFRYRTANDPDLAGLMPFEVIQASRTGKGGFDLSIAEKAVLEIADTVTFTRILHTQPLELKKEFGGNNGTARIDWSDIKKFVFKEQEATFPFTKKGTYYWRVRWLTNPDGPITGVSYNQSETWEFTIGEPTSTSTTTTTTTTGDTPPLAANDCKANCEVTLPANPVASGIAPTLIVKVGHFAMRIVTATPKAGNAYDGEGIIKNFSIWGYEPELKVQFTNLKVTKVDTYLQAFAGEVNTLTGGHELLNLAERALDQPLTLPLGFDFMLQGNRFILQLTGLKFLPTKAEASFRIAGHIPGAEGDERKYDIVADKVCMVPGGFGGTARFFLNANIYGSAEADAYQFYIKGREEGAVDRSSYVEFKCDTLSLQLAGGLRFPRTKLLPEDDQGQVIAGNVDAEFLYRIDQRVTKEASPAGVTTTGMVVGLTFNHPFQVVGFEGWGFRMQDAFVDMSDMSNPPDMQFPAVYNFASWLPAGQTANEQLRKTWEGVYGRTFALRLPKELTENRKSYGVRDLIIDKTGVTLSVEAENVLSSEDAGWGFSIDKLTLSIIQTSTFSGNMKGKLQLPVFDPGDRLDYTMLLSSQPISGTAGPNYICTVSVPAGEPLNMNLWLAKMQLDPSSQVEFSLGGASKIRLKGHLNGSFGIYPGGRDELMGLKLNDVRFENFSFDTDSSSFFTFKNASYSRASGQPVVSFASPQHSAAKFPLTINEIDFIKSSSGGYVKPGLHIDADLALSDEITAGLGLTIYGKLKLAGVRPVDVGYDHTDLQAIRLDVETKGFTLKGEVEFYKDHADYGDGFYGNVAVTMPMKIGGRLTVRFGTKGEAGQADYYSYWFVDGMIHLKNGIAIGPLSLNAFGGGAYHHMRLSNPNDTTAEKASRLAREALAEPDVTPDNIPASGLKFVPDKNVYLGIRAGVVASMTGESTIFNMDVGLTAEISGNGGLNNISLNGNGYLLQELDTRPEDPPMKASVLITYDRTGEKSRLDGNFQIMVDFYDILVGRRANNIAGEAQLHIDDEMWYFYLGNPSDRAGLKARLKVGKSEVASLNMDAYFMVGHGIPPELPPLPEFVRNMMNHSSGDKLDNQVTSDSRPPRVPATYENGKGIAFGGSIDFHTKPTFLVFYADLRLVVGADINITKNESAVCVGSNEPRGVNGWYGQGQAYAAISGAIGIHVDLVFIEGNYEIASVGAAIAMMAKLPNPNYFSGRAALYYSILDGLVDGHCNFNLEFGENCVLAGNNPLADLNFISDMQPDGGEGVSPGTDITTSFFFPMDKEFELEEVSADGSVVIRKFKPFIKRYELFETKGNSQTLVANLSQRFERNNAVTILSHRDYLKGNTPYKAIIEVQVYETTSGSPVLVKKTDSSTEPYSEERSVAFKTGPLPQMLEDVVDSWPVQNQRFFLQNQGLEAAVSRATPGVESFCLEATSRGKKGYIKVGGQAYLFTNSVEYNTHNAATGGAGVGRSVAYKAIFTPKDGSAAPTETNMKYYSDARAVEFDIPKLTNSTTYQLTIVRKVSQGINTTPTTAVAYAEDRLVTTMTTQNKKGEQVVMEGGSSTVARRQMNIRGLSSAAVEPPVFTVFSYTFRTSRYNSHRDKLAALTLSPGQTTFLGVRTWTAETDEAFETVDLPSTIITAANGVQAASGDCGAIQLPLMQILLPDMDNTYLTTAHRKFQVMNEQHTGYNRFRFPGIQHEKNIANATDNQIRNTLSLGSDERGLVLSLRTGPQRIASSAFVPALAVLPNLLGSGSTVPLPFKTPYYVSSGLVAPLDPSVGMRPNVAASAVAVTVGVATASTSNGPSFSGAPTGSPGSTGNGKPKVSIMDMTDLVLTAQNYQIISNLLTFQQMVPPTLSTPVGELTLYNATEKNRLEYLIRQEPMLDKVMRMQGKQRMQFIYRVPTMYGSYSTAPVTFEGTIN